MLLYTLLIFNVISFAFHNDKTHTHTYKHAHAHACEMLLTPTMSTCCATLYSSAVMSIVVDQLTCPNNNLYSIHTYTYYLYTCLHLAHKTFYIQIRSCTTFTHTYTHAHTPKYVRLYV